MLLEYSKNGSIVKCLPLYDKVRIGRAVVLTFVSLGEDHPLFQYSQPAVFVVRNRSRMTLTLLDHMDQEVVVPLSVAGDLFDAHEWAQWNRGREVEKVTRKDAKIKSLEGNVDLLSDILTKQGVRVITREDAERLGIK